MSKITTLHAHFLISVGNYSNERIGFSVEINDESDNIEEIVAGLRKKAISIIGLTAEDYYQKRYRLKTECLRLEAQLARLTEEWNRTADFLKAQGINVEAPKLTPISGLLSASKIEQESIVQGEIADDY